MSGTGPRTFSRCAVETPVRRPRPSHQGGGGVGEPVGLGGPHRKTPLRQDAWAAPTAPVILGSDVAGRVEAVGSAVESFRPGDDVFGDVMYHERLPSTSWSRRRRPSSTSRPRSPSPMPPPSPGRSHRPPGHVGEDRAGDRILVNGAGGGTGAFAIQMAKAAEAEATGVDNGFKQDFMRSLGDHVLDYTQTDYTNTGNRYDLILDLVCERSIFAIRRAVAPGGRYAVVGGSVREPLSAAIVGRLLSTGGRRMGVLMVRPNKEDLRTVADMVVGGALRPPSSGLPAERSARGATPPRRRPRPRKARHRGRFSPSFPDDRLL